MKQLINSITILTITITFVACGDSEILLDSERTYGIRHDRTLEEYENLALQQGDAFPNFESVVCFTYSLDGSDNQEFVATGTLITDEWILTTVYHPTWISDNMDFIKGNDLCLVKLTTPITDREPIDYWQSTNEPVGDQIWFCGFGDYSQLQGQDSEAFSKMHAVENVLDRKVSGITTVSNGVTYDGGLLAYDFDHPDETINSLGDDVINDDEALLGTGDSDAQPLDYEGGTVQGDSGGPLFMTDGQQWKIAGVLSGGANEPIADHEDASYGDISVFIRVSSHADWIEANLRSKIKYYFDSVINSSETLIVPRGNDDDESVVIMSLKEYNSLQETNYLMSTSANRARLLESIAQAESGDIREVNLDEIMGS